MSALEHYYVQPAWTGRITSGTVLYSLILNAPADPIQSQGEAEERRTDGFW
jgi:hypothetical protein